MNELSQIRLISDYSDVQGYSLTGDVKRMIHKNILRRTLSRPRSLARPRERCRDRFFEGGMSVALSRQADDQDSS